MNPITISAIPTNGVIEVFLGVKVNGYLGLVDIAFPEIDTTSTVVSISCDQVDSTCFNRKRILRIFHNENSESYTSHQFNNITYYKLDSSDYKLTIRLFDDNGPITFKNLSPVIITLNLKYEQPKKWINM